MKSLAAVRRLPAKASVVPGSIRELCRRWHRHVNDFCETRGVTDEEVEEHNDRLRRLEHAIELAQPGSLGDLAEVASVLEAMVRANIFPEDGPDDMQRMTLALAAKVRLLHAQTI